MTSYTGKSKDGHFEGLSRTRAPGLPSFRTGVGAASAPNLRIWARSPTFITFMTVPFWGVSLTGHPATQGVESLANLTRQSLGLPKLEVCRSVEEVLEEQRSRRAEGAAWCGQWGF